MHTYRNALTYVRKLDQLQEHVKTYRPQILVLTGNAASRPALVDFTYSITKKDSMMICGYVVPVRTVFSDKNLSKNLPGKQ